MHKAKMLLQIFAPIMALAAAGAATANSGVESLSVNSVVKLPFDEFPNANQLQYELGSEGHRPFAQTLLAQSRARKFSPVSFFTMVVAALTVTFLVMQCFKMLHSGSSKPLGVRRLAVGGKGLCKGGGSSDEEDEEPTKTDEEPTKTDEPTKTKLRMVVAAGVAAVTVAAVAAAGLGSTGTSITELEHSRQSRQRRELAQPAPTPTPTSNVVFQTVEAAMNGTSLTDILDRKTNKNKNKNNRKNKNNKKNKNTKTKDEERPKPEVDEREELTAEERLERETRKHIEPYDIEEEYDPSARKPRTKEEEEQYARYRAELAERHALHEHEQMPTELQEEREMARAMKAEMLKKQLEALEYYEYLELKEKAGELRKTAALQKALAMRILDTARKYGDAAGAKMDKKQLIELAKKAHEEIPKINYHLLDMAKDKKELERLKELARKKKEQFDALAEKLKKELEAARNYYEKNQDQAMLLFTQQLLEEANKATKTNQLNDIERRKNDKIGELVR